MSESKINKLLAIVVPAYNAAKTIDVCVQSIIGQTSDAWNLIIVDDGSTDDTLEICRQYEARESRITVFHQENSGVSSARNRGVELAESEWITFVDSDDFIADDYVEHVLGMIAEVSEDTQIAWGYEDRMFAEDGQGRLVVASLHEKVSYYEREAIMDLFELGLAQSPVVRLYRKTTIVKNGIRFREDLDLGEDLVFNLTYMDAAGIRKMIVLNRPIYICVCTNAESLDRRFRPDLMKCFDEIDLEVASFLEKWHSNEETWQKYWNMRYYHYERALFNLFSNSCMMNAQQRRRQIREMLTSESCKEAYKKQKTTVNPMFALAFRLKSGLAFEFAIGLYHHLKRVKSRYD